jgi:hypothetical protein
MRIDINSRKLGRTIRFIARESSGYVYVYTGPTNWGRQVFDRNGAAEIARSEAELRRVARRYISRLAAV